jgi:hypothetical protein
MAKSLKEMRKMHEEMPNDGVDMMRDEPKENYTPEAVKAAFDTLVEAEQIKKDVKLMGLVQAHARKQDRAIKSIQDIKDRYVTVSIKTPEKDLLNEDGSTKVKVDTEESDDE